MSITPNVDRFLLCRRPAFSPDGALLITPTGIHRVPSSLDTPAYPKANLEKEQQSFCTHIYSRDHIAAGPVVSLVGLEDPSVAVRFSPVLYEMISHTTASGSAPATPMIKGKYRYKMMDILK